MKRWWVSDVPWRAAAAVLLIAAVALLGNGLVVAWADEGTAPSSPTTTPHVKGLDGIAKSLMCTCGCNLTVAACEGAMTCEVSKQMKQDIADRLASGMSTKQVLASFQADYGEQVLAAPTKKGFNLTAWVLPFVALAIGLAIVALALIRWRKRGRPTDQAPPPPLDPTYASIVDEEVARGL